MSRFQFETPDLDEARAFLTWRRRNAMFQAELYHDAIVCVTVVQPATRPDERAAVREYLISNTAATFPCPSCGRFAFPSPRPCFWCAPRVLNHAAAAAVVSPTAPIVPDGAPIVSPAFSLEMLG